MRDIEEKIKGSPEWLIGYNSGLELNPRPIK